MIKVSVVIPIYNVEKYLEECLQSIVDQTLKEIEIICVNDGSTDSSLKIIEKFMRKDKRVRVINKPNSGYGHSMNIGIYDAKGEYIGIVESDDYIDPKMYETLYEIAQKTDVDFAKSNFYYLYGSGKNKIIEFADLLNNDNLYDKVFKPNNLKNIYKIKTTNWTGLYKRSFIFDNNIKHNETPGASYQDTGFCFSVFSLAQKCIFIKDPFLYYRQDNPNASMKSRKKVYAICSEYKFIYDNIKSSGKYEELKGIYTYRKFDAYFNFNFKRISPELRYDFLKDMSLEFRESREREEVDSQYFDAEEFRVFNKIIDYPDLFFIDDLRWNIWQTKININETQQEMNAIQNSRRYKLAKKIIG